MLATLLIIIGSTGFYTRYVNCDVILTGEKCDPVVYGGLQPHGSDIQRYRQCAADNTVWVVPCPPETYFHPIDRVCSAKEVSSASPKVKKYRPLPNSAIGGTVRPVVDTAEFSFTTRRPSLMGRSKSTRRPKTPKNPKGRRIKTTTTERPSTRRPKTKYNTHINSEKNVVKEEDIEEFAFTKRPPPAAFTAPHRRRTTTTSTTTTTTPLASTRTSTLGVTTVAVQTTDWAEPITADYHEDYDDEQDGTAVDWEKASTVPLSPTIKPRRPSPTVVPTQPTTTTSRPRPIRTTTVDSRVTTTRYSTPSTQRPPWTHSIAIQNGIVEEEEDSDEAPVEGVEEKTLLTAATTEKPWRPAFATPTPKVVLMERNRLTTPSNKDSYSYSSTTPTPNPSTRPIISQQYASQPRTSFSTLSPFYSKEPLSHSGLVQRPETPAGPKIPYSPRTSASNQGYPTVPSPSSGYPGPPQENAGAQRPLYPDMRPSIKEVAPQPHPVSYVSLPKELPEYLRRLTVLHNQSVPSPLFPTLRPRPLPTTQTNGGYQEKATEYGNSLSISDKDFLTQLVSMMKGNEGEQPQVPPSTLPYPPSPQPPSAPSPLPPLPPSHNSYPASSQTYQPPQVDVFPPQDIYGNRNSDSENTIIRPPPHGDQRGYPQPQQPKVETLPEVLTVMTGCRPYSPCIVMHSNDMLCEHPGERSMYLQCVPTHGRGGEWTERLCPDTLILVADHCDTQEVKDYLMMSGQIQIIHENMVPTSDLLQPYTNTIQPASRPFSQGPSEYYQWTGPNIQHPVVSTPFRGYGPSTVSQPPPSPINKMIDSFPPQILSQQVPNNWNDEDTMIDYSQVFPLFPRVQPRFFAGRDGIRRAPRITLKNTPLKQAERNTLTEEVKDKVGSKEDFIVDKVVLPVLTKIASDNTKALWNKFIVQPMDKVDGFLSERIGRMRQNDNRQISGKGNATKESEDRSHKKD